ncbi:superfamily II DNA RNA helicase [Ligilactobacillus apodemi DSM 16634 = JCM 16172]|uniref:Superfamily II DNA RNA helicase n=2 Tax=Ligilactobacillus TaxID=2767887 RepID=A0A0R1TQM4_9LACO|nr:helicase-related protein [Ligilactobacillus apodemi]KRL83497.1 superfamily II DNA RNA helicase [Ligilactobacillus apodemi DSM 16634 = JCM 16172]
MLALLYGRQVTQEQLTNLSIDDTADKLVKRQAVLIKKNFVQCQRCGSLTPKKVCALPNKQYYCPKCLLFGRLTTSDILYSIPEPHDFPKPISPILTAVPKLSKWQALCAKELVTIWKKQGTHLLWAVTGAGKTEILFEVIKEALKAKQRICLAAPRVDVCVELAPRIKQAFAHTKISVLYGNSRQPYRYTQLVICTVHQLFNFYQAFDLLILDETDAYPFIGDKQLHFAVANACCKRATKIFLTATPDKNLKRQVAQKKLTLSYLPLRYHRFPLPEAKIILVSDLLANFRRQKLAEKLKNYFAKWFKNEVQFLVFVPQVNWLGPVLLCLQQIFPQLKGTSVHANDENRLAKVKAFRAKEYDYLVTTTILERGITIKNVNVIVLAADSPKFSQTALVQIAGRVGRNSAYPCGDVIFCCEEVSLSVLAAKFQIKHANQRAKKLLVHE